MSAVASALDMHTPCSYGENGHYQHTWSHSLQERILQLSFQLTRTSKETVDGELSSRFRSILADIDSHDIPSHKAHYLDVVLRIICHTRDVVSGKGEYNLAYMLVYELWSFYPEHAERLVEGFVRSKDGEHQLGSWKDIKYICNYCRRRSDESHPLIKFCVGICLKQLRADSSAYVSKAWAQERKPKISLVARWIPRETAKSFGWLSKIMAETYNNHLLITAKTEEAAARARTKAKMLFRRTVSELNKYLDTPQIKQCDGEWSSISFPHMTSVTMRRQSKALRNVDAKGEQRSFLEDRVACAKKFSEYLGTLKKTGKEVKGKRVSVTDFVKDALDACRSEDAEHRFVLNSQWRDSSSATGELPNMIAMVDTSGSMTCDNSVPLHSAIGLGCRIAEKSRLGRRVMTFSSEPRWINLDSAPDLTDMVERIHSDGDWGLNTNFTAALQLILDAICERGLKAEEVEDMVLVILSDMQIDSSGNESISETMLSRIRRMYEEAGERTIGAPYTPPHILFWNLRSTRGFPALSSHSGCSMMSGASPSLLNVFCEKGMSALRDTTPWSLLMDTIFIPRYEKIVRFE